MDLENKPKLSLDDMNEHVAKNKKEMYAHLFFKKIKKGN